VPVRTRSIIAPYASGELDHGAASVGGLVVWGRPRQLARSAVETSARPRDGSSALLRRDGQSGSIELKPLPTAKPIDELTTAIREEGAQRLIFDQALRFAPRTPCDRIQASSGLSESCPKNADVPKSPFPCSGSPGAVGRHNNT
jgi:hypothetical protein